MTRRELIAVGAALGGSFLFAGAPAAAANPIFDGWYADPQIRRYGDEWWVSS